MFKAFNCILDINAGFFPRNTITFENSFPSLQAHYDYYKSESFENGPAETGPFPQCLSPTENTAPGTPHPCL